MMKEYKESDLDHRKELPVIVVQALALILVLSIVGCYAMAIWVLK